MKCNIRTHTRIYHTRRTRIDKATTAVPTGDSMVILLGIDPAIAALANRNAQPMEAPPVADRPEKTVYRPVCWQTAKVLSNEADKEDVLAYAGSAAAARLFRCPDRIPTRDSEGKRGWKAKKAARQWTGCPVKVTTKHDKRTEVQRQARREKQLGIPPWDQRMMAAFCK